MNRNLATRVVTAVFTPQGTRARVRALSLAALLLALAAVYFMGSAGDLHAQDEGVTLIPGPKWLDFFCIGNEQCAVGDFNGDGKADVAVFYRDTRAEPERGDVMVAVSNGDSFSLPGKWAESFCTGSQVCKVGDFNGDGRDDLIAFNPTTTGQVSVALSTGTGFQDGVTWAGLFCVGAEICEVGDFNGDHRDDIVLFKRSAYTGDPIGDVVVALSNGVNFGAATLWHNFFCYGGETCTTGDFNGDGRDDVISFAKSATGSPQGYVFVALSTGAAFGTGNTWSTFFCVGDETCAVGDFTGDGKTDALAFLGAGYGGVTRGDTYVAVSKGNSFGDGWLWHPDFCRAGEACMAGDFNGDGKDDVVRFIKSTMTDENQGDIYVALSAGAEPQFVSTPNKWHETFCGPNEICATGDVNGDGLDDVITFVRSSQTGIGQGDVLVSLSNGESFGATQKWHEEFCVGDEICRVGDVNGDGYDDIVAFARSAGPVWVALSNGSGFGAGTVWNAFFCVGTEVCEVGDFNGDGYADVAAFTRGTTGDVYVALSNGSRFNGAIKWHDFFCILTEECRVGDVNGDGRTDIVSFTRSSTADVFVGLSNGTSFATGVKWHDFFCALSEVCAVGDFNGDGRADVATFLRNGYDTATAGDVFVGLSTGGSFSVGPKWHEFFCVGSETCGVGDFNGDRADDVVTFTQGSSMDVYVALSSRGSSHFAYLRGPVQNPIYLPLVRMWAQ